MINLKLPIFLLTILYASMLDAQSSKELAFSLIAGNINFSDELRNPLVYGGGSYGISASYTLTNDKRIMRSNLGAISELGIKNRYNNKTYPLNAYLNFSYTKRILKTVKPLKIYTGGKVEIAYQYNLGFDEFFEYPLWLTQYNLQWSNDLIYTINERSKLSASFSIPLFGLYARPEEQRLYEFKKDYLRPQFHNNLQSASLDKFRSFYFDVTHQLRFKYNPYWKFFIAYALQYTYYEEPRPITFIRNSIRFGLIVELNRKKI